MAVETSGSERMLREGVFRERRRRVLYSEAAVAVAGVVGLCGVVAAKELAPGAFAPATAFFLVTTFGAMLVVRRTANRYWRCPACDVRWETHETLASFYWNHCATCGAALRAHPLQRDPERVASTAFLLEGLSHEELVVRFQRRRRRRAAAAVVAAAVGVAAFAWLHAHGASEIVERGVGTFFGALVAVALLWSVRCPRCTVGIVGNGRHCQRCGLSLEGDPDEPAPRRTAT